MLNSKLHTSRAQRASRGFSLIEVLIALLVFSFGVLALVGLQASALRLAADARDRTAATFLADQLVGLMLISNRSQVTTFEHLPDGGDAPCEPSGDESDNAAVTAWLAQVALQLPGAASSVQQVVVVNSGVSPRNTTQVTVNLCWQRPGAAEFSRLTVVNRVPWPGEL